MFAERNLFRIVAGTMRIMTHGWGAPGPVLVIRQNPTKRHVLYANECEYTRRWIDAISKQAATGSSLLCHRATQFRGESAVVLYSSFLVFEAWQTYRIGQRNRQTDSWLDGQIRYNAHSKGQKGHIIRYTCMYTYSTDLSHSRLGSCNYVQTRSKSSALVSTISNSYTHRMSIPLRVIHHVSGNLNL